MPVRVVLEVPGDLVEFLAHDVRGDDRLVAALAQAGADELLDDAADDRAFGVPKDQTAARVFLYREEIELNARACGDRASAPLQFG